MSPMDSGPGQYGEAAALLRALANSLRLAIVHELSLEECCVHDLVERLGVPQPLVSQHLGVLRAARLVEGRRSGREVLYRLVDEHIGEIAHDAIAHAEERQ